MKGLWNLSNYPSACVRMLTKHSCAGVHFGAHVNSLQLLAQHSALRFGAHANSLLLLDLQSAIQFGAAANSLLLLALLSARNNTKVYCL